jgi:hypothetical protein
LEDQILVNGEFITLSFELADLSVKAGDAIFELNNSSCGRGNGLTGAGNVSGFEEIEVVIELGLNHIGQVGMVKALLFTGYIALSDVSVKIDGLVTEGVVVSFAARFCFLRHNFDPGLFC